MINEKEKEKQELEELMVKINDTCVLHIDDLKFKLKTRFEFMDPRQIGEAMRLKDSGIDYRTVLTHTVDLHYHYKSVFHLSQVLPRFKFNNSTPHEFKEHAFSRRRNLIVVICI